MYKFNIILHEIFSTVWTNNLVSSTAATKPHKEEAFNPINQGGGIYLFHSK
jgi:hypothetical protein